MIHTVHPNSSATHSPVAQVLPTSGMLFKRHPEQLCSPRHQAEEPNQQASTGVSSDSDQPKRTSSKFGFVAADLEHAPHSLDVLRCIRISKHQAGAQEAKQNRHLQHLAEERNSVKLKQRDALVYENNELS